MSTSADSESQAGRPSPAAGPAGPERVPLALVWSVVLLVVGGMVCSWLVIQFGELGSIGFWGVGGVGGAVARKIMRVPSRLVAIALVVVCVLVFPVAEVSWIHWKTEKGAEKSWVGCISLLPVFVQEYRLPTFIGALFTFFGAQTAYWQAGRRYRIVVEE